MKRAMNTALLSDNDGSIGMLGESKKKAKEEKKYSYMNKEALLKFSQEKCEFCEELFFCHYDLLTHNTKHIIIPITSEIPTCPKCNQHFLTATELELHSKVDHFELPEILKSIVTTNPVVECDETVTELIIQDNEKKLDKILTKKAVVECDSTLTELIKAIENDMPEDIAEPELIKPKENETLKDIVMKQPIVYCEDTFKGLFNNNTINETKTGPGKTVPNKTVTKKKETSTRVRETNTKIFDTKKNFIYPEEEKNTEKLNMCLDLPNSIEDGGPKNIDTKTQIGGNIKDRLVFEDDEIVFEVDMISTNFNDDNGDHGDFNGDNDVFDLTIDDSDDDVTNLTNLKVNHELDKAMALPSNIVDSEENIIPSVHYDDLILPETMECKHCDKLFINRYSLLTHEAKTHLRIKQMSIYRRTKVCNICDQYIVGNHFTLKRHKAEEHPFVVPSNKGNLKHCSVCKLKYYAYGRHSIIYHQTQTCPTCSKTFMDEATFSDHINSCKDSFDSSLPNITEDRIGKETVLKVCEFCSLFLKNTQMYKYFLVGTHSKQGKRITCERCEKQFFEVKLIKLVNKHPTVQPFYDRNKILKIPKPTITNEKRLKNIRRRLKMIKKIH